MNDDQQEIWFYSRDGEKCGPVSFADLRIKAQEAGLNPRLDLAWTKGMAEWKPAGEIEGLFERHAAPEPQETLAPAAGPYQPPQAQTVAGPTGTEVTWPGARRRSYLFMTIIFPTLFSVGFSHGPPFLAPHLSPQMNQSVTLWCMLVPLILAICFSVMRLANLGMSRWWFFANFVPFLNIWIGYRCFACPAGYDVHKKLDGIGVFLAIIYWLMLVLAVLLIAAIIAVFAGALGSPEILQQIQDQIRAASTPKP